MSTNNKNKHKSKPVEKHHKNGNSNSNTFKNITSSISKPNNNERDGQLTTSGWWNTPISCEEPLVTMEEEGKWYDKVPCFDIKETTRYKLNRFTMDAMLKQLPILYTEEVKRYSKFKKSMEDNDQKWIDDVIRSGTLSDKIAALTLQVQESPVHQLNTLDILIDLALKKDQQRTSLMTLEALKDLLLHNLLPDRKLIQFNKQPLGHPSLTKLDVALALYYESQLCIRVSRIIDALEVSLKSSTSVDFFKKACLVIICDLLVNKPEQEARLLSILVYKLGDVMPTVSTKAADLLKLVVKRHPAMKLLVVREIKALISDPKLKPKTVFTGAVLLTQLPLPTSVQNSNDPDVSVAEELIDCYVGLFEKAVLSDEMGSRLLSILLSGINKAYPCCSTLHSKLNRNGKNVLEQHMDALYKLVHTASFATATQSLMLLSHAILQEQVPAATTADVDNKNGNEKKNGDKKQKSKNRDRGSAVQRDTSAEDRYYRALYAQLLSDQVASRSKNTLFLNLLYRSIKKDTNVNRIKAFLKRLIICATQSSASITTGLLLLISEICKSTSLNQQILKSITENVLDTEAYGGTDIGVSNKIYNPNSNCTDEDADEENTVDQKFVFDGYDANKRDAAYAIKVGANATIDKYETGTGVSHMNNIGLWELTLLRNHFHPSVQAFATSLLSNANTTTNPHEISFNGDPIVEFNLSGFLNRLSYKNAKKRGHQGPGADKESIPINKEFLPVDIDETTIAPDKMFFHKYFGARTQLLDSGKSRNRSRNRTIKNGEHEDDSDFEVDDEGDFDNYADKLATDMLRANNPDVYELDELEDSGSENGSTGSGSDLNPDELDGLDEYDDSDDEGWDGIGSGSDSDGDDGKDGMGSVFAEKIDSDDEDENSYQLTAYGDNEMDNDVDTDMGSGSGWDGKKKLNDFNNKKRKLKLFNKSKSGMKTNKRGRH